MSRAFTNLFFDSETRQLARRILHEHVAPYRKKFYQALFFMFLVAASNSALAYLLKPITDHVFINGNTNLLYFVCAAIFILSALQGISSYFESVLMTTIGQNIITDLQNRLFKHLVHSDLAYFHKTPSGEILSRFISDIYLMRTSVSNVIVGLGKDFLSLIFLIALMFWCDWLLALLAFTVLPVIALSFSILNNKMRKATNNTQDAIATLTIHFTQVFQGIRLVKSYCMESYETSKTRDITKRLLNYITKGVRVRSSNQPIIAILTGMATAAIIAYGGLQVINGVRTAGDFITFIAALAMSYEPIKRLSNTNANLQEGLAAATRVFKELDIPTKIVSQPQAKTIEKVRGEVELKHVNFGYAANIPVLFDFSLKVAPGKTIALVGASGSGKSTLINLIPRFYDVTSGSILIDGIDIREFDIRSLRKNIALVSQEVTLFDDTIANNIRYGYFDATEDEIVEAAKAAAAHEFIMKLPQQYNTLVGENGVKLSGGQRQRISIARAMLKNAPILLLDEATSALDSHSEKLIQATLNELIIGRTTIIVAHRLSTIMNAECIYVLDHGKVCETGTHQQLLEKNGLYASLWYKQTVGDDIAVTTR